MTLPPAARGLLRRAASLAEPAPTIEPRDDWPALDRLAIRAGLAEPLFAAVQRLPESLRPPGDALPQCRSRYFRSLGTTSHLLARAARLGADFCKAGITAVALKGLALAIEQYPEPGARPMCDLDLLVGRHDLERAEQTLLRAGYRIAVPASLARRFRGHHHHLPPYRHPDHADVVELHHALVPPKARVRLPADPLISSARPLKNGPLLKLSPADLFLHLALHLLYSSPVVGRLRQLLDLHLVASRYAHGADFQRDLADRAARCGIEAWAALALELVRDVFETVIPSALTEALHSQRHHRHLPPREQLRRAVLAALDPQPDLRLQHRMTLRKMWLERPTLPRAVALLPSAAIGEVRAAIGSLVGPGRRAAAF